MDFEDLVTAVLSPPNRVGKVDGTHEHHLYEGAVMISYAMHLLRTEDTEHVRIHPDGEHGKQFDFAGWLLRRGFGKASALGTTTYGGVYRDANGQMITINPKSGLGDVVAEHQAASSPQSARVESSTHPIPARFRAFIRDFVRR